MEIKLGDNAPDFTQESTEGQIEFHKWIGSSWGVLFSHPADFTPGCTTELGEVAKLKSEFDKRNVKVIGLSIDSRDNHEKWINDINETQNIKLTRNNVQLLTVCFFRNTKKSIEAGNHKLKTSTS